MDQSEITPERRRILMLAALGGTLAACGGGGGSGGGASAAEPPAPSPAPAPAPSPGLPAPPAPLPAPAPTPGPPSSGITTLAVMSAGTGQMPVAFSQVFKLGDMPAGAGLAGLQLNVKSTWPDGSAAIGIVSCLLDSVAGITGFVGLTIGTSPTGPVLTTANLKAIGMEASITAGAFGSASWAATDWDTPFIVWATGPVMSSWIYRKQIGIDAHLSAWLEVRLFANGAVEILPWVENGFTKVPNPNSKEAKFSFSLGGAVRFEQNVRLLAHTRTPLIQGAMTSFWLGPTQHDIVLKHDSKYMQRTGLVPSYQVTTAPGASTIAALPTTYTPFQQGTWDSHLATGGWHNHVCLIPEWDAFYLTSTAAKTFKGVIFQAYSAGRFDWCYRDEGTHRAPLMVNYPRDSITSNTDVGYFPLPRPPADPLVQNFSIDHGPSIGYMAYLITGRWYFMDMVQTSSMYNYLACPYYWRQDTLGIYDSRNLQVRGMAWAWRTLATALRVTPDDDMVQRSQLLRQMQNNIDFVHKEYVVGPSNPQGWMQPLIGADYNTTFGYLLAGSTTNVLRPSPDDVFSATCYDNQYKGWKITIKGETRIITASSSSASTLTVDVPFSTAPAATVRWDATDDVNYDAPWMQDYHVAVLGWIKDMRLPLGVAALGKLEDYWVWKSQTSVARMGSTNSEEWLYRDPCPYALSVAPSDTPTFAGGAGPWYPSWGRMYETTYGGQSFNLKPIPYASPGPRVDGPLRVSFDSDGQFANFIRGAAYAAKHNAPGAAAGWARLTGASNYGQFAATMNAEGRALGAFSPGEIAIPPLSQPLPQPQQQPAWNRGQLAGEWREIPGSAMALSIPMNTVTTTDGRTAIVGPSSRMRAWCGLSIDTRNSNVWSVANGGHGDYFGNECLKIDLMADAPAWVEWFAGSSGPVVNMTGSPPPTDSSYARYLDGQPPSTHSYFGQQFMERHNRAMRLGGSTGGNGTPFTTMDAFNTTLPQGANGYELLGTYPGVFSADGGPGGYSPGIEFCCCKDPRTEQIYSISGQTLWRFTPNTSGLGGQSVKLDVKFPTSINSGNAGSTAIDTKRNRLYWTHGYGGADSYKPSIVDLDNMTWTVREHPTSAAAADLATRGLNGLGLVYVPMIDAYLLRGKQNGSKVYRVDAETFEVAFMPTTGGAALPAAEDASDVKQENVYNRWLWVPQLRGVVYFPGHPFNGWFLQL